MTVLYIKNKHGIDILAKNGHTNTINVVLLKYEMVPDNIAQLRERNVVSQNTIQKLFEIHIKKYDIPKCTKLIKTNLVQKEYKFNKLVLNYLESCKNHHRSMGEWIDHIDQKAKFMINLFIRNMVNYDYLVINATEAYIVAMIRGYYRLAKLAVSLRMILHKRKRLMRIKLRTIVLKRKMLKELRALPRFGNFPGGTDYLKANERITLLWQSHKNPCS